MSDYKKMRWWCGIVVFFLFGCVFSNGPVSVYRNDILDSIYSRDKNFAAELSRIPGTNAVNSPYRDAMKGLFSDYQSGRYREAFEKIIDVGDSGRRPYAPALEAFLWLYRDDPTIARQCLIDFSLETLLSRAWGKCEGERWDMWEEVRMRLTAPELCVYFTKHALRYIPERSDGKNYLQSPSETLMMRGGDCEDFAALIAEGLEFGGYFARLFTVDIYTSEGKVIGTHTVALFRGNDNQHYFIQGFDGKYLAGDITGPFETPEDMARFIAKSVGGVPAYYYIDTPFEFIKGYEHLNRGKK